MPKPATRRRWHRTRLTFRWFRIGVWLLLLGGLCALLWLNRVGLPESIKGPVLAELGAHGLKLAFDNLRLHWHRGIVAENVWLEPMGAGPSPRLSARELTIHAALSELARGRFKLDGIELAGGDFSFPLVISSNVPSRHIVVTNLRAQVDFLSNDRWQLSTLEGVCSGIEFHLSGMLSNGPALLTMKGGEPGAAERRAIFWNQVMSQLGRVRFPVPARLKGSFVGDGTRPEMLSARVAAAAPRFETPWGSGRDLEASVSIQPRSNNQTHAEWELSARDAQTPQGKATSIRLKGRGDLPFAAPRLENAQVTIEAESVGARWGRARHLEIEAEARALTSPDWADGSRFAFKLGLPEVAWGDAREMAGLMRLARSGEDANQVQGLLEVRIQEARSPWIETTNAVLTAQTTHWVSNLWPTAIQAQLTAEAPVSRKPDLLPAIAPGQDSRLRAKSLRMESSWVLPADGKNWAQATNVSWAGRLERVRAEARLELQSVRTRSLEADRVGMMARWRAPDLAIESIRADLLGGQINATARLDTASREVTAWVGTAVDPHLLAPHLTTNAASWRSWVRWDQLPRIESALRLTLPAWTNSSQDWLQAVLPSLRGWGELRSGRGALREVGFDTMNGQVALTNLCWQVREVEIGRPEGQFRAGIDLNQRSKEFAVRFKSKLDPKALRPVLKTDQGRQAMDLFELTEPPLVEGELRGRLEDWERLRFRGKVALTNVVFRQQALRSCVTEVAYADQMLDFLDVRILREEGAAAADQIRVDLRRECVSLTNLESTIEPGAVAAAIGPHIVKTLDPYKFRLPPKVWFQGTVGIRSRSGLDDARFEVTGRDFQWQNFRLSKAGARLHWLGDTLTLTNFEGTIHAGPVKGSGFFDFSGESGTQFRFDVTATNVDAQPFVAEVFPHSTNRLEGLLSGHLAVTSANTTNDKSWDGYGDASLCDGLIWNVPIFGYFSPILNRVVPGLGNSRARRAAASFQITNSVIATRDLEVSASAMRMQFSGTVDFEGRVRGRMEAELFRETPGFGWFISRVFWPVTKLFVFKIGGTLNEPKMDTLYIPKVLMAPFHPLRTLKELFSEDKSEAKAEDQPASKPEDGNPSPDF